MSWNLLRCAAASTLSYLNLDRLSTYCQIAPPATWLHLVFLSTVNCGQLLKKSTNLNLRGNLVMEVWFS